MSEKKWPIIKGRDIKITDEIKYKIGLTENGGYKITGWRDKKNVCFLKFDFLFDKAKGANSRFLYWEINENDTSFILSLLKEEVEKIIKDLGVVIDLFDDKANSEITENASIFKESDNAPYMILSFGIKKKEKNLKISFLMHSVGNGNEIRLFFSKQEAQKIVKALKYFEKNMVSTT